MDIIQGCNTIASVKNRKRVNIHLGRANILTLKGFDWGRCSFLTLSVANAKDSYTRSMNKRLTATLLMLRRKYNLRYYITASEIQQKRYKKYGQKVLHYHIILFNVPYIPYAVIKPVWRLGAIHIEEAKNARAGLFYLLHYVKEGVRVSWSRSFVKDGYFPSKCFFVFHYDKKVKKIVFGSPVVPLYPYSEDIQAMNSRFISPYKATFERLTARKYVFKAFERGAWLNDKEAPMWRDKIEELNFNTRLFLECIER